MVTKLSDYEKALFAKAVSAVFGEARVKRKMSQKSLADKVGIASRTTICQVENRHRNFKYEVAVKVAKVLKIEIDLKKAPKLIASNPVHEATPIALISGSMYGRAPVAVSPLPADITPAEASTLSGVVEETKVEVEVVAADEEDEEEDTEYADDDVEDDDDSDY